MNISTVKQKLSQASSILITAHRGPDGDAIGSTLGLYHCLSKICQASIVVMVPDHYPEFLKWMPGNEKVVVFDDNPEENSDMLLNADIIFSLDYNALGRVKDMERPIREAKAFKIMIDHHQQPESFPDEMLSKVEASSTSELVYEFVDMLGELEQLDKEAAMCLYTGILTDTGSFRFDCTSPQTHRVVAHLIEKGVQIDKIYSDVFDTNSTTRLKLLGYSISEKLKSLPKQRTSYISLTTDELNNFNFKKGDTEGIVNYGLSILNIRFTAFFRESEEGYIKISFRSKGTFDVNQFARNYFNGGGHKNAAGGRSDLSMKETIEKFEMLVKRYEADLIHLP